MILKWLLKWLQDSFCYSNGLQFQDSFGYSNSYSNGLKQKGYSNGFKTALLSPFLHVSK